MSDNINYSEFDLESLREMYKMYSSQYRRQFPSLNPEFVRRLNEGLAIYPQCLSVYPSEPLDPKDSASFYERQIFLVYETIRQKEYELSRTRDANQGLEKKV